MCDPISLGVFALSAAQSGLSYASQSRQAKEQNRLYEANAKSALSSTIGQFDDIALRREEEQEAASQALFDSRQESLRVRSSAQVASGEAGVSGVSVDALLRSLEGSEARQGNRIFQTFRNTDRSLTRSLDGIHAQGQNQVNSVRRGQAPSPFQLAVGVGSSVLQGLQAHRIYTGGKVAAPRKPVGASGAPPQTPKKP